MPVPGAFLAGAAISSGAWWFGYVAPDKETLRTLIKPSEHADQLTDKLMLGRDSVTDKPLTQSDLESVMNRVKFRQALKQGLEDYIKNANPVGYIAHGVKRDVTETIIKRAAEISGTSHYSVCPGGIWRRIYVDTIIKPSVD